MRIKLFCHKDTKTLRFTKLKQQPIELFETCVMKIITIIVICISFPGCVTSNKKGNVSPIQDIQIIHEGIKSGIPVYREVALDYRRKGKSILTIKLAEPDIIDVAARPEKWGFFQFPKIGRKQDGALLAKWHMAADAVESYGTNQYGSAVSADGGKTWKVQNDSETIGGLLLPNGDRIAVVTPKPVKTEEIRLPKAVGARTENYPRKAVYTFYRLHDLPESCQGVSISRLRKGEKEWKIEKASLSDPQAARYELKGLVPILWSGDMHMASDGSIIAGVYPGFYVKDDGIADPKDGIFFYRSIDNGYSWTIQGRIRYTPDLFKDPGGNSRMGFMEPTFEILADGTFLCVVRTSDGLGDGPMYASYSKDMGVTWSKPEALTSSGVCPVLLQLDNGVIALASGRPGVQLRFSTG